MSNIISIANQKGGVGKTTTAVILASELGKRGHHVLLIDLDSQGNATFASGFDKYDLEASTYNVLTSDPEQRCTAEEAILQTKYYDILPADNDVSKLNYELTVSFTELSETLKGIRNGYDYILLDCPPALSRVMCNALTASDYVLLCACEEGFSETGLIDLQAVIRQIKAEFNKKLRIAGIIYTKHDTRSRTARETYESISDWAKRERIKNLEHCTVRKASDIEYCMRHAIPLCDYRQRRNGYKDYQAITDALLERIGG